jgi:hypothetical protein
MFALFAGSSVSVEMFYESVENSVDRGSLVARIFSSSKPRTLPTTFPTDFVLNTEFYALKAQPIRYWKRPFDKGIYF